MWSVLARYTLNTHSQARSHTQLHFTQQRALCAYVVFIIVINFLLSAPTKHFLFEYFCSIRRLFHSHLAVLSMCSQCIFIRFIHMQHTLITAEWKKRRRMFYTQTIYVQYFVYCWFDCTLTVVSTTREHTREMLYERRAMRCILTAWAENRRRRNATWIFFLKKVYKFRSWLDILCFVRPPCKTRTYSLSATMQQKQIEMDLLFDRFVARASRRRVLWLMLNIHLHSNVAVVHGAQVLP